MQPLKSFHVFGDLVEIFVNSEMSDGSTAVLIQSVAPGGGPPPHSHANEDETFVALEGDFEILADGRWRPVARNEPVFGLRGSIHTFRNAGDTPGRIMVFVSPGGFENYLEEISPYSPGKDLAKIFEISKRYGVTFHL